MEKRKKEKKRIKKETNPKTNKEQKKQIIITKNPVNIHVILI